MGNWREEARAGQGRGARGYDKGNLADARVGHAMRQEGIMAWIPKRPYVRYHGDAAC